jgi:hypothetical protein
MADKSYLRAGMIPVQSPYGPLFFQGRIIKASVAGFDHGVGHSLLLLYDAKTPHGQKVKEFNCLGYDLSNTSKSLF